MPIETISWERGKVKLVDQTRLPLQGDVLVCNNCGNRFPLAKVGLVRGGCNPVPIAEEARTEDAQFIVVAKAFLEEAAPLFLNWKKR